jgi:flavodoxin
MNYAIVYFSRFGNGKKIVDYVTEKLNEKKAKTQILKINDINPKAMPKADIYIFSAPAEAFSLQRGMKDFMINLQGMDGNKYAIINTHAMKKNRLAKMEKILSKKNMIKKAELDFQVSKNFKTGNALPEDWKEKADDFINKL